MEGPGEVSLMVYDNNSFVVESFLDKEVTVKVLLDPEMKLITDVASGETSSGKIRKCTGIQKPEIWKGFSVYEVNLKPHSFKAFTF